jgi:hypothetical protein
LKEAGQVDKGTGAWPDHYMFQANFIIEKATLPKRQRNREMAVAK